MTDFLTTLVRSAGHSRHLLTKANGSSTAIDQRDDGSCYIEHPAVANEVLRILERGEESSLILRTFTPEISHTLANGTPIPIKEVRGWYLDTGVAYPLSGQQMLEASCIDADTGEAIPPEEAVRYVDAYVFGFDE
ncbi:hypothetical protein ACWELJ_09285 [Nocardia sp. NPDC004582]